MIHLAFCTLKKSLNSSQSWSPRAVIWPSRLSMAPGTRPDVLRRHRTLS